MRENEFIKICKIDELKDRQGKRFLVDDVDVAVFKVDDKIYALSNLCPHQKTALMYDGYIENGKVGCPVHGWEFDLETGKLGDRRGIDTYEVKIENDDVFVKVFKKEFTW